MGFDNRTAHHMALLAMEQYGRALAGCNSTLSPADSIEAIRHGLGIGRIPVWMPVRMVLDAEEITPTWEVTADSLAAWLGGRLGGGRLFLVKHTPALSGRTKVEELAALGIVDEAFPLYLKKSSLRASILGPCDHDAVSAAICAGTAAGVAIE
jgi:dihydroneopterin aldolase